MKCALFLMQLSLSLSLSLSLPPSLPPSLPLSLSLSLSTVARVMPVATDLFTIHSHTLHLLQAHWHPSHPHTLLLLTSDSTLRVFSMADPNYARSTIPLTPSAAAQVNTCPHLRCVCCVCVCVCVCVCMGECVFNGVGTWRCVPIREVSSFQMVLCTVFNGVL